MTRDLQRNYQSSRSKKKNHRNHYTAVILSSYTYTCDTHSSTAERQKDDTTSLRRRKRKGTAVVIFLPPVYTSSFTILPRRRDKSAAPHIEESREREQSPREENEDKWPRSHYSPIRGRSILSGIQIASLSARIFGLLSRAAGGARPFSQSICFDRISNCRGP